MPPNNRQAGGAATDFATAGKLDPQNPEWPRRLRQIDSDVVSAWNFDFGADGWQAENQIKLVPVSGSFLRVSSTGSKPQITTPVSAVSGKLKLTLRAG